MKNKKTIALAMAAATVAPMAVPAFAADVETMSLPVVDGVVTVDNVRTALTGYEIVNKDKSIQGILRIDAFDSNGTSYTGDDTLKATFGEDAKVIAIHKGNKLDLSDYSYVIAKKADTADFNAAKAELESAKAELTELKEKGYTITQENTREQSFDGIVFKEGQVTVTAKLGNIKKVYVFNGVEGIALEDTTSRLREMFNKFSKYKAYDRDLIERFVMRYDLSDKNDYNELNEVKYLLEQNASRFDFEKVEINGNKDLKLTVSQKGAKGVEAGRVVTIVFENFADVNKDLIVDMPAKTDYDGHWAEAEIKEAMLKGYVDASSTFRPKDGITRAEFTKMVCTIFNIPTTNTDIKGMEEPFHDVTSSDWYYRYIVALYNYDNDDNVATPGTVINGYEGDNFKPNAKITRQEAAKIVASALEIYKKKSYDVTLSTTTDKGNGFVEKDITIAREGIVETTKKLNGQIIHRDIKTNFVDDKDIASWADESVHTLNVNKILGGNPDGTFKPNSDINRAEALCIIMRAQ